MHVARDEDDERVQRGDPEEVRGLVERRLADQVLVAVVEAGDLARPARSRAQRPAMTSGVTPSASERGKGREDREGRGEHVRDRERAPVERVAAPRVVRGASLGDLAGRADVADRARDEAASTQPPAAARGGSAELASCGLALGRCWSRVCAC